ncbi:oxidoreductase [Plantactinospora sp. KLBMP9567]|uniref:oxidoreductase n=1 Tax=Plantactinospora sp. KLBMP9567 TaxID=3085900 RepID=UPI002982406A|nr:oxidoreductase [Plantactinospora sp. KLBMP9567]MDW5325171.1 oxidoreductase [Plantactinospora sp. KLBMP9567]
MRGTAGWTLAEMPGQTGRTALVTGANSGVGYETSRALARVGATVIMGGRDESRLAEAATAIRAETPGARLEVRRLDLADLDSVRAAAAGVLAEGRPLDLLFNNAGVMAVPQRRTTRDGFELTFGTNHLGHFALTGHLLPALLSAGAARVVTVSAIASRWPAGGLADVNSEQAYRPMQAYAVSKFANVVFTQELARRAAGTGLVAVAAHPGVSQTNITREVPRVLAAVNQLLRPFLFQSTDRAALPSLYAATHPDLGGGEFVGPTGLGEGRGAPGPVRLPRQADDPEVGRRLWELSERLTGVDYAFPSTRPAA